MLNDGTRFSYPPHLRLLNDALMDVAAGRCDRLAVFMPPRHVKSTMCSRNFPAWYLCRFPERRLLLVSYGADFAATWGGRARALVQQHGPSVFGVDLASRASARNSWVLTNGSEMHTCGVGGSLTGRGADVLIIDDPVQNAQQALSATWRERTWDWYLSTAYTRLEPGGSVILIMTRWHEDDLAGRILEADPDRWRVLSFPAVAEEQDVLGRAPGDPLWPERYGEERLAAIRERLGTYWWNALYQQRPAPVEGAMFLRSWWRWYDEMPEEMHEVVQSWDMAFTDTKGGSYVVGQVWGKAGDRLYLLDQVRGRWSFTETLGAVRALTQRWPQARVKLVEAAANGPAVMDALRREIGGFVPVRPAGSKEARAAAVTPLVEAGRVHLPRHAPWVEEFVEEWAAFPRGAHDDQVDAGTQAFHRFMGNRQVSRGWVSV